MRTIYHSKIDTWLGVLLITTAVVSVAAGYFVLAQKAPGAFVLAMIICATGAGLPIWLLSDTTYVIEENDLLVRSGPLRWRISLKEIRSIKPTRSPISSPALSLDRLQIDYGIGRSCMVSPKDRERFIAEIRSRAEAAA